MSIVTNGQRRELWVSWVGGSVRAPNGILTIGRESSCEVSIRGDAGVSRRHARLTLLPTSIKLQDLGSRNGTFIEGRRLTGTALLRGGELLRVGNTELRAFANEAESRRALGSVYPRSHAPFPAEFVDTTVSTNVFGGLLRDIARATLTDPSEVGVLVAEACDTAENLAMTATLSASDAAVVADCVLREARRTEDSSWIGHVFVLYSKARLVLPLDLARSLMKMRKLPSFPEDKLGGYLGVLAGLKPAEPEARELLVAVFRVLAGE